MRVRKSARHILLDEENRILLFKVEDSTVSRPDKKLSPIFWITPGGAVEIGETDEDTLRRELWEETGIREFELGPLLAVCEPVLVLAGETVQMHDRFYLTPIIAQRISLDNMIPWERDVYRDHRWWTVGELRDTCELVFPFGLADLVEMIASGEHPTEPIQLPPTA